MLNIVTLVGRLTQDLKIKELENEKKVCYITIAVPRSFKNNDGVYETDFINITLYEGIATTAIEYLKKGDLLGIKGRIQNDNNELKIIAEKVSFLSNSKE